MPAIRFRSWVIFALLLRIFAAAIFPFDGDESYYLSLASQWLWGFYDHPPLLIWVLHLLRFVGDWAVWLRLPAVLCLPFCALVYDRLGPRDHSPAVRRAITLTLLYWPPGLVPWLRPDSLVTPLAFLSVAGVERFVATGRLSRMVLAGASMGLAFLAKYSAVPLGLAILIYVAFTLFRSGHARRVPLALLSYGAGAAPFLAQHLFWNSWHCWSPIALQLIHRFEDGSAHMGGAQFALVQLLLLTPIPVVCLLKPARSWRGAWAWVGLFGIAFFVFVAFRKGALVYWGAGALPFLLVGLIERANERWAKICAASVIGLGCLWVGASGALFAAVDHTSLAKRPRYNLFELYRNPRPVARAVLAVRRPGEVLTSTWFAEASLLSFASASINGERWITFPGRTGGGRGEDEWVDFRALDGRDFLIFSYVSEEFGEERKYFGSFTAEAVGKYYVGHGSKFNFVKFRDTKLAEFRDSAYGHLREYPALGCPFVERYF